MKMPNKTIGKTWGWERWFDNNSLYCGKELFVRFGDWSSKGRYHYHKIKTETFFVTEGQLRIDYVTRTGEFKTLILNKEEAFRIDKEIKHRFTSATPEGCKFIEVSTTHRDDDSYRCECIDGEWVEE